MDTLAVITALSIPSAIAALATATAAVYRDRIRRDEKERDELALRVKTLEGELKAARDQLLEDTKELATAAVVVIRAKEENETKWSALAVAINRAYEDRPRPR